MIYKTYAPRCSDRFIASSNGKIQCLMNDPDQGSIISNSIQGFES